jgi:hypothetical protein
MQFKNSNILKIDFNGHKGLLLKWNLNSKNNNHYSRHFIILDENYKPENLKGKDDFWSCDYDYKKYNTKETWCSTSDTKKSISSSRSIMSEDKTIAPSSSIFISKYHQKMKQGDIISLAYLDEAFTIKQTRCKEKTSNSKPSA